MPMIAQEGRKEVARAETHLGLQVTFVSHEILLNIMVFFNYTIRNEMLQTSENAWQGNLFLGLRITIS